MAKARPNKRLLKNIDWILLAIIFVIVIFGVICIMSATTTVTFEENASIVDVIGGLNWQYSGLQLAFFALGLVACGVVMMMDYNNLRDFSAILYWVSVALLLAVLLFGGSTRGVSGWFMIGNRGFQPAELCKIVLIIVLAKQFADVTERNPEGIKRFRELWPMAWRFAIPFVLIILQPDWGTAMVYVVVLFGLLFLSRTSLKIIGILVLGVGAMVPAAWFLMAECQKQRILTFLYPETMDPLGDGFHSIRAKEVVSAGGLTGKGLFSPDLLTQQTNYLPEEHTDFIFAASVEAVGYVGGIVIVLLYGLLIFRLIQLSTRAKDDFGTYIVLGVSFMLLFHVFENVGMNIGIMPITGIPLPLFSYGGSNMLTTMIAIGLCLNVNMRSLRRSI